MAKVTIELDLQDKKDVIALQEVINKIIEKTE